MLVTDPREFPLFRIKLTSTRLIPQIVRAKREPNVYSEHSEL